MNPGEADERPPDPLADNALVVQARDAEYMSDTLSLYGDAISEADEADDVLTGFQIRSEALWSASSSGRYEMLMNWFAWCIAQRDRVDDELAKKDVLWAYKWVAHCLMQSPEFSRQQIAFTLDDLEREYVEADWGRRGPMFLRLREAMQLGLADEIPTRIEAWLGTERDDGADCEACEFNLITEYFASVGEDARAVDSAEPLLDGRMSCSEVPGNTRIALLAPLTRLGRTEDLLDAYHQSVEYTNNNAVALDVRADLLRFQLHAKDLDAASAMVNRFLHLTQIEPRFTGPALWLHALGLYYRACAEADRTPAGFAELTTWFGIDGKMNTESAIIATGDAMTENVNAFAKLMDQRNGNPSFSDLIRSHGRFVTEGHKIDLDRD